MTLKPLLIGEACQTAGGRPFDGRAGRFLAGLCEVTLQGFLRRVQAINLLPRPQDLQAGGKGRTFDLEIARRRAGRIDVAGRCVVLAGKRVARAFGLTDPPWLEEVHLGRGEASCIVMPHPSGIVRWWNEGRNRRDAGRVLRLLLLDGGEGGRGASSPNA